MPLISDAYNESNNAIQKGPESRLVIPNRYFNVSETNILVYFLDDIEKRERAPRGEGRCLLSIEHKLYRSLIPQPISHDNVKWLMQRGVLSWKYMYGLVLAEIKLGSFQSSLEQSKNNQFR